MELSVGSKIYLERDFIKQFEPDSKTSRSFQVIAITDVAIGLKNLRTSRTYTLSLAKVADNIDHVIIQSTIPKSKVVLSVSTSLTLPPEEPEIPPPVNTPPEMFTHIAPISTGGLKIKRINAITQIEGDDPFGSLYT